MTYRHFSLAAVVLLAATIAKQGTAQLTCTGLCSLNSTASVSVPSIMRLTLGTLTTTLTNPTETAFDAGFQDDAGPTATVKSNRPWNLTIGALTASWVGSNGGRATKGASDLQFKTASTSFASLSQTAGNVLPATQGAAGNASVAMQYRTVWSYAADVPGDYTLVVVYSLIAP